MDKKIVATTNAPAAIGPYSQAVIINGMLYTSGQIPLDPATGEVVTGSIEEQTHRVFKNLKAVLEAAGTDFNHVIKTTVFLADIADFAAMNGVYAQYFTGDYPARSAVQVACLPKNVGLEIELIAKIDD